MTQTVFYFSEPYLYGDLERCTTRELLDLDRKRPDKLPSRVPRRARRHVPLFGMAFPLPAGSPRGHGRKRWAAVPAIASGSVLEPARVLNARSQAPAPTIGRSCAISIQERGARRGCRS